MVTVRTSRLTGAAALLVVLALPSPVAAQPAECPQPGLGPPTVCVDPQGQGPVTTLAPDEPVEFDPGPALWVGAVFGASGLAGMAYATARARDDEPEERR